eukprot:CAMPEP_0185591648 /NCGR_PEP_ID=MMETSP0434-20130131/65229_1 /TAXON_ID=626734 ORGANISM="Favella taraikaensis, Strain Fe Narragansett Bay" /NCGR_SAMPLE_ID=MMETSP0434 /ASSEMBLY_ACC=CAM_ASM_000379 /LENGTH=63 /DNA_ID=CAMNT_0028216821 /DNA_START=53 /DNA_END=241 /DNA_ORIENTATION=+
MDEEDEHELKDFKHLTKAKMIAATHALFREKAKELTFPKNPTLFTKDREQHASRKSRRNNTCM